MAMQTFSYELPEDRIAQRPVYPAHAAKLLVVDREGCGCSETTFDGLPVLLRNDDVLVFNNTKVIPARFITTHDGKNVEIFLVDELAPLTWRAIGRPMKTLRRVEEVKLSSSISIRLKPLGERELQINFYSADGSVITNQDIFATGLMPIPPYIRKGMSDAQDSVDYQTIFSLIEGSVAAPTASLHFSNELVQTLDAAGVTRELVTLHVGLSSILGLGEERPGSERFVYDEQLNQRLLDYRQQNRRIIAVGTTVVRALESFARKDRFASNNTDLFITPGFEFKLIDGMITNFHMPDTTHLLLVEAFMKSRELLAKSYQYALEHNFRFLSYGDGMLIV